MAVFRTIQCSFWNDPDLVASFTPEDRYFYLYLMTNEHTSQCGIYQISIKQIAFETGYSIETVKALLDRFERLHKRIRYNHETKELAVRNHLKYNGPTSAQDNTFKRIVQEFGQVQDRSLIGYVVNAAEAPCKALLSPFVKEEEKDKEKEQEEEPLPSPSEPVQAEKEEEAPPHFAVANHWYARYARETSRLISPSGKDHLRGRELYQRLSGDMALIDKAIDMYFDRWEDLWYARKGKRAHYTPDFSFACFCSHIDALLAESSTAPTRATPSITEAEAAWNALPDDADYLGREDSHD